MRDCHAVYRRLAAVLLLVALSGCAAAGAPPAPAARDSHGEAELLQALAANSDTMIALAYLRAGDPPAAYRTLEEGMYDTAILADALLREPVGPAGGISDGLRRTALCHLWRIRAYRDAHPPSYDWPEKARAMEALADIPASPAVPPQCKELMEVKQDPGQE